MFGFDFFSSSKSPFQLFLSFKKFKLLWNKFPCLKINQISRNIFTQLNISSEKSIFLTFFFCLFFGILKIDTVWHQPATKMITTTTCIHCTMITRSICNIWLHVNVCKSFPVAFHLAKSEIWSMHSHANPE